MYDLMQCVYTLAVVESTCKRRNLWFGSSLVCIPLQPSHMRVCLKPTDAAVKHVSWMQHCPS